MNLETRSRWLTKKLMEFVNVKVNGRIIETNCSEQCVEWLRAELEEIQREGVNEWIASNKS